MLPSIATYVDRGQALDICAHSREEAIDKLLCDGEGFCVRRLGSATAISKTHTGDFLDVYSSFA